MTNTNELLPCPFCGNKRCVYGETGRVGYYYIDCNQCHTTLNGCDLEDLIEKWNTRVESQQSESLKSENERLRKALEDITNFDTTESYFAPGQVIACSIKNIATAALAQPKE